MPSPESRITSHDATALAEAIRRRRASPVEVVDGLLARIERENPRLNAFVRVFGDQARRAARRAEKLVMQRRPGTLPPLLGVPVSVKDIVFTIEAPSTAGSRVFGEGLGAGRDAPVVRRLRRAGAIVIGKTLLHEVALGVTSANEHFGPVRNPHDPSRVAGGSSGGSAAAVAAGLGPLSIGTDTRGSIRIPAACCGVVGLKPTYGLVPADDVVPLSPSLDHVGPIASTVAGCALMLEVMAGPRTAGRFLPATRKPARGMRVGVSEYHLRNLDAAVQRPVESAIASLAKLGCRLRNVRIPELDDAHLASMVIGGSEAVAYHDQFLKTRPEAYGPLVRKRLQDAYRWTALDLLRAYETRTVAAAAFAHAFREVDCLVGAVLPALPCPVDETNVTINGQPVSVVEAFTRFNAAQNLAGVPAVSVPCGAVRGLPVALQIIGPRGGDASVLRLAAAMERP